MSTFDVIHAASPVRRDGPRGWIQFQGTNLCMDVHCACGAHGHVDSLFAFHVRCGSCGQVYGVDPNVTLVPVKPEDIGPGAPPVDA